MRFYGNAMRFPHVQGAFRESLVCLEAQAHPVAEGVTLQEAAMAEPLAVALHATRRSGSLMGRRVLVSGSGPIGALGRKRRAARGRGGDRRDRHRRLRARFRSAPSAPNA